MSDNFVTCRHCGIGINYACDHSDDDVPQEDVDSLVEAAQGLLRFVRHNERCSVWAVGAPACNCGLAVALGAFATAFAAALAPVTTREETRP